MTTPNGERSPQPRSNATPAGLRGRKRRPGNSRSRFLFQPEVGLLEKRALLTQINLNPYVNNNLQTYSNGTDYPLGGSTVTVGGVGFTLASDAGVGTGVIQARPSVTSAFDVSTSVPDANTVYALINSTYGVYGDTIGSVEFKGTGGLDDTVNLVEGQDIRDHNNFEYNNTTGRGTLGGVYLGTASYGGGQVRFDELGFTLPTSFQSATLTDIILHGSGNYPDGNPFLAAVTVATGSSSVAVPTQTSIRASTATAAVGQSVTFTATVGDLTDGDDIPNGGTVSFGDVNGVIGTATLVDGVAEFTTTSLPAGTINVSASYGGDSNFGASATGTITTIAGNGVDGYKGNGGLATAAELNYPWGSVFDPEGNLFIADANNNVIREVVKATGDIITVAGTGTAGYSGDGGLATAAKINDPNSVAVDSSGNLYISDEDNNRIREVLAGTGDIITIAGNGTAGYTGDNGLATAAELNSPRGLSIDLSGNVYYADVNQERVREIVKATGDIITVAGTGVAGYNGDGQLATAAKLDDPRFVNVDPSGNLYIGDTSGDRIREVVKATGDILTLAGTGVAGFSGDGGLATAAKLNDPNGISIDANGDVFFTDVSNYRIREVVAASGDIITVAGDGVAGYSGDGGPATAAELNGLGRVSIDAAGNLFMSDNTNSVIREITPGVSVTISGSTTIHTIITLKSSTSLGAVGGTTTLVATVTNLSAGGAAPNGGTVIFSNQNGQVGTQTLVNGVATLTLSNSGAGTFRYTVSYGGSTGYSSSGSNTIITAIGNGALGYEGDGGPGSAAELDDPFGVAVDSAGDLFIADTGNNVVREVVKATGDIITVAGNGIAGYSGDGSPAIAASLNGPIGLCLDSAGNLYIADLDDDVIREVIAATGIITTVAGNGTAGYSGDGGLATAAELDEPRDVAVDAAGDLFITDSLNNVIREVVKATGDIITYAGTGQAGYTGDGGAATAAELYDPVGVAIDAAGDLDIADFGNNAIREVFASTGLITTIAGTGIAGYSGDNGPATAAELNGPGGLAVDAAGNLYIADEKNDVVREVLAATGDIITFAGTGTIGYSGDGGTAIGAELDGPYRIAVDPAGDVFLSDGLNNAIREITPGAAVTVGQLVITTQAPTTLTAGNTFSLVVKMENGSGVTLANYNGPVTIQESGSGVGSLLGTLTVTMVDGVATFSGLSLYRAGTGETLIVSIDGLLGVTTAPITVLPAQDNQLVVEQYSSPTVTAGAVFFYDVAVEDQYGNIETGESGSLMTISLIIGTGPLLGTTSVTISDGIASFQGLSYDVAQDISFKFTYGAIVDSDTNLLAVTAAAASKLVLVTPPSTTAVAGSLLAIEPLIAEVDQYGNREIADYTTVVTVSLAGGSGPLLGSTTEVVAGGLAWFVTLADSKAETITLNFASGSLTGVASGPIAISKATPTVTFTPPKATSLDHQAITLTATIPTISGLATPTGTITFLDGSTVLGSSPLVSGHATLTTSALPLGTQSISVTYTGDSTYAAGTSPAAPIYVGDLAKLDFDGDGKADIAIFDPVTATFAIQYSGGSSRVQQLGNPNDVNIPVFGDYDGDGKTDVGLYDQTAATFLVLESGGGTINVPLGNPHDVNVPVTGDFIGVGRTNLAIFDQTTATFYVLELGKVVSQQLGISQDVNIPVAGDYDGDGKTDFAVYDQTRATFLVQESGGGSINVPLGNPSDKNVPEAGDFTGAGKTNLAIFDPTTATFYVLESGKVVSHQLGIAGDTNVPVAGDYDGDGKTDFAVYDQTQATFLILDSGGGSMVDVYGNPKHKNIPG